MPLVWVLVVIAGFFITERIIADLNTTTDDQAALVKATGDFCKQNNLSPEECKAMLKEQNDAIANTDSNSTSTGSIFKIALWLGLAFLGVKVVTSFSGNKTANG